MAAFVASLCVAPLVLLDLYSLATRWPAGALFPEGLTLRRWAELFQAQSQLGWNLVLSIGLASSVAAISTTCGFVTAKYIAYHSRRQLLLLTAYVPFAMSPVILGTCLLFVYLKLHLAGGLAGVLLAQTIFGYGFAIVFFMGFWSTEKRALEELVYTLGGSTAQLYRRVLWPVSRPALGLCAFQTFLLSWFDYGLCLLIGSGKVKTLTVKVYEYIGEANVFQAAMAGALLVLPPVIALAVNRHLLDRTA